jgi:superfamily II DNA or RNA helicase
VKPYKWQETALERFARSPFFCLWVDCGCGKTLAGTLIAREKRLPTITVAPGHLLCNQWKKELIDAGVTEEDIWVYNRNEERKRGEAYALEFREWLEREDAP